MKTATWAIAVAACVAVSMEQHSVTAATPPKTCNAACPEILAEVCGSDGKTYANECEFEYTKCTKNLDITLVSKTKCKANGAGSSAGSNAMDCAKPPACPAVVEPVCGSDGKTYSNECVLNVAKCDNKKLKLVSQGECSSAGGSSSGSFDCSKPQCQEILSPVCGSNGKTYDNECELHAAACKDKTIKLVSKGRCSSSGNSTAKPGSASGSGKCIKMCLEVDDPVCGSDGKTYSNECLLENAQCSAPTLKLKSKGACSSSGASRVAAGSVASEGSVGCEKACTKDFKELCGSNGVTYTNDCLFQNAKCNNSTLKVQSQGACKNASGASDTEKPKTKGAAAGATLSMATLAVAVTSFACVVSAFVL